MMSFLPLPLFLLTLMKCTAALLMAPCNLNLLGWTSSWPGSRPWPSIRWGKGGQEVRRSGEVGQEGRRSGEEGQEEGQERKVRKAGLKLNLGHKVDVLGNFQKPDT